MTAVGRGTRFWVALVGAGALLAGAVVWGTGSAAAAGGRDVALIDLAEVGELGLCTDEHDGPGQGPAIAAARSMLLPARDLPRELRRLRAGSPAPATAAAALRVAPKTSPPSLG